MRPKINHSRGGGSKELCAFFWWTKEKLHQNLHLFMIPLDVRTELKYRGVLLITFQIMSVSLHFPAFRKHREWLLCKNRRAREGRRDNFLKPALRLVWAQTHFFPQMVPNN